ncbi:hypothetical protein ACFFK0_25735 [Paenibacillus chartarius]|uniref:Uncharacterized protein n=1 Tax=Paenibacillus chartarius TaxID=747481 RepID=A0ABV6DT11_9BACL
MYFAAFADMLSDIFYITVASLYLYYLVWLYQVHSIVRRLNPLYEISAIGAVLRMMPIIQLFGFADTFNKLGEQMRRYSIQAAKTIRKSVIYFYILSLGAGFAVRVLNKIFDQYEHVTLLLTFTLELALIVVFMIMTIRINSYIDYLSQEDNRPLDRQVVKALQAYMKEFHRITALRGLMTDNFIKEIYFTLQLRAVQDMSVDDMLTEIKAYNQRKSISLTRYAVSGYRYVANHQIEVTLERSFNNGLQDEIIYIFQCEDQQWKLHHIVRAFQGRLQEVTTINEITYIRFEPMSGNPMVVMANLEMNTVPTHDPFAFYAYIDVEASLKHENALIYALYKLDHAPDLEQDAS